MRNLVEARWRSQGDFDLKVPVDDLTVACPNLEGILCGMDPTQMSEMGDVVADCRLLCHSQLAHPFGDDTVKAVRWGCLLRCFPNSLPKCSLHEKPFSKSQPLHHYHVCWCHPKTTLRIAVPVYVLCHVLCASAYTVLIVPQLEVDCLALVCGQDFPHLCVQHP